MNDIDQGQLSDALARMNDALRILDEAGAPGDIGGHLDLAIARLEERLGAKKAVPSSLDENSLRPPKDGSPEPNRVDDPAAARDIAPV